MSRRPRVSYRLAGRAHRETNARAYAIRFRLKRGDWATLAAALEFTASYSRVEDWVYATAIATRCGYHEKSVRISLSRLDEFEVLIWEPSRGNGQRSFLGLYVTDETGHLDARSDRIQDAR